MVVVVIEGPLNPKRMWTRPPLEENMAFFVSLLEGHVYMTSTFSYYEHWADLGHLQAERKAMYEIGSLNQEEGKHDNTKTFKSQGVSVHSKITKILLRASRVSITLA